MCGIKPQKAFGGGLEQNRGRETLKEKEKTAGTNYSQMDSQSIGSCRHPAPRRKLGDRGLESRHHTSKATEKKNASKVSGRFRRVRPWENVAGANGLKWCPGGGHLNFKSKHQMDELIGGKSGDSYLSIGRLLKRRGKEKSHQDRDPYRVKGMRHALRMNKVLVAAKTHDIPR